MKTPKWITVDATQQILSCARCGAIGGPAILVDSPKQWERRVKKFVETHTRHKRAALNRRSEP